MGNLIASLASMLRVELTPRGSINCSGDAGDKERLSFEKNFRCEFPEISIGEWYRSFRLTAPEWIPFAVLERQQYLCLSVDNQNISLGAAEYND